LSETRRRFFEPEIRAENKDFREAGEIHRESTVKFHLTEKDKDSGEIFHRKIGHINRNSGREPKKFHLQRIDQNTAESFVFGNPAEKHGF
jgi:hypothetical protein